MPKFTSTKAIFHRLDRSLARGGDIPSFNDASPADRALAIITWNKRRQLISDEEYQRRRVKEQIDIAIRQGLGKPNFFRRKNEGVDIFPKVLAYANALWENKLKAQTLEGRDLAIMNRRMCNTIRNRKYSHIRAAKPVVIPKISDLETISTSTANIKWKELLERYGYQSQAAKIKTVNPKKSKTPSHNTSEVNSKKKKPSSSKKHRLSEFKSKLPVLDVSKPKNDLRTEEILSSSSDDSIENAFISDPMSSSSSSELLLLPEILYDSDPSSPLVLILPPCFFYYDFEPNDDALSTDLRTLNALFYMASSENKFLLECDSAFEVNTPESLPSEELGSEFETTNSFAFFHLGDDNVSDVDEDLWRISQRFKQPSSPF